MKNKKIVLLSIFNFFPLLYLIASQVSSDLSVIKQNYKSIYIDNDTCSSLMEILLENQPGFIISDRVVMELQQRVPFDKERIESYMMNLRDDGSWADINYNDKKRSGWEPRLHAERILEMVKAYVNPSLKCYESSELEKNYT